MIITEEKEMLNLWNKEKLGIKKDLDDNMSKGYKEFYELYNEFCNLLEIFKKEYIKNYIDKTSEEKLKKIKELWEIAEMFNELRIKMKFHTKLSFYNSVEEYKELLAIVTKKKELVSKTAAALSFKLQPKKIFIAEDEDGENYENNSCNSRTFYDEDYEAERRVRLDMYEDANDITDEGDYWDYIGDDY